MRISGGTFQIGDQFSEGDLDEKSKRWITLKSFLLGVTEVTQAQWKALMGSNPSRFKGEDRPVEKVSWHDVLHFIRKLNVLHGDAVFRLPTEAEWEYACREGGGKVRYCNGKDEADKLEIHFLDNRTMPVASFPPNSLGLYDMSGNVWEWTCSEYRDPYNGSEESCGCEESCTYKYSLRGGSWSSGPRGVRSANRNVIYGGYGPEEVDSYRGFRLARD